MLETIWELTQSKRQVYQGIEASGLLFPVSYRAAFQYSETFGYFGPSVLEQFGMDAIMLQEKLVERLLCPRVRTARQKVKR